MNRLRLLVVATLSSAWIVACASMGPRDSAPPRVYEFASPPAQTSVENWALPPEQAAQRLTNDEFEIRSVEGAGGGTTGATKVVLFFPEHGDELTVKWKPVPAGSADHWNNAPRKELAAYAIQEWILEPEDYVVPTSVARCIPLDAYRKFYRRAKANIEGTDCVLGIISIWMVNLTAPDTLHEE